MYSSVVENDASPVVYVNVTSKNVFKNWGMTVQNIPAVYNLETRLMCRLPSFRGVWSVSKILFKYAQLVNKRVRCCGYRYHIYSLILF
jgi:hypothetical protein